MIYKNMKVLIFTCLLLGLISGCNDTSNSSGTSSSGGGSASSGGTTLGQVSNVQITSDDSKVNLTWDTLADAAGYNVYFSSDSTLTAMNYASLTEGTLLLDQMSPMSITSLQNDTTYYFLVVGVDAQGDEGLSSAVVSTTPLTPSLDSLTVNTAKDVISFSWEYGFARKSDGTVWSWGENTNGQLGNGTTIDQITPAQLNTLGDIKLIKTSSRNSYAITTSNKLWIWGSNGTGQLGDGTTTDSLTPKQVTSLSNVKDVCGNQFTIALLHDGTVWSWGVNSKGHLGLGAAASSYGNDTPQQVAISDVIDIECGSEFTLALKSDGTVWAWGDNYYGQIGNNKPSYPAEEPSPVHIAGLTNITSVSAGHDHALALKSDGTVWSWGDNSSYALGNGTIIDSYVPIQVTGINNAVEVEAGANTSFIIRADGTLWELGDANGGNSRVPNFGNDIVAIESGNVAYIVVKSDGSVWGWGQNNNGELGNGTTDTVWNIDSPGFGPTQVVGENGNGMFNINMPL